MTTGLTNATLTEIRGPGLPDDSGDVTPDSGTVLWSGRADGYLKRSRKTVVSGGMQMRVNLDVFVVLVSAGAPVAEVAGPDWEASTVVIEDQRVMPSVTRRFTVDAMEHRAAGTVVDSVRLELSREMAA